MIHVERLMQGTSQEDELTQAGVCPILRREGHSTLDEPGSTRVENTPRSEGERQHCFFYYLFKEDVDGRS